MSPQPRPRERRPEAASTATASAAVLALILAAGHLSGCHTSAQSTPPPDPPNPSAPGPQHAQATDTSATQPRPTRKRYWLTYPEQHQALLDYERSLHTVPAAYADPHSTAAHERARARAQAQPKQPTPSPRFYADGLYHEPHTGMIWAFSRTHPEQRGFIRQGKTWQLAATRTGPLATRRCQALTQQPLTLCLGQLEAGGLRVMSDSSTERRPARAAPSSQRSANAERLAPDLPERSGFRDFAVSEARRRIYLADAYRDALWVLELPAPQTSSKTRRVRSARRARAAARPTARVLGQAPLAPSAYRVGTLGDDHLFVLAGTQPYLQLIPLDDDGMPGAAIAIDTPATIRAAIYDPSHAVLWTAGYEQTQVRREHGYISGLGSYLYAYRAADLARGQLAPIASISLAEAALSDPVALAIDSADLVAAIAGSHQLLRVPLDLVADADAKPKAAAITANHPALTQQPTSLVPKAVLAAQQQIFAVGYFDDRLSVHRRGDLSPQQSLSLAPAPSPAVTSARPGPPDAASAGLGRYDLGELLFYSKALWSDVARNQFTCNSCHWDGLTDYRVHPGFRESRWEQIRPAAGAGVLAPVFSPGQSDSLTRAIHGFLRSLDQRFWDDSTDPVWMSDISLARVPQPAAERNFGPLAHDQPAQIGHFALRQALIAFLALQPVEPGLLRAPGTAFSPSAKRGAALFWRDCARCHQPTPRMGQGVPKNLADGLDYLVDRPLAFGAAELMKTGPEPYFTKRGNRVSPLLQLSRGGPFFTNSAARTLAEVIARVHIDPDSDSDSDSGNDRVHLPESPDTPHYSPADSQALIDFLLSI